jgi:hypothetical protein
LVVDRDVLQLRKIVFVTDTDGAILARTGVTPLDQVVVSPNPEAKSGDRVQVNQAAGKGNP